jgi:hypothetical protein
MVRRPWLVPALASLIAVALLVAGIVTWRMMSPPACQVAGAVFCVATPAHRLHPLRAELLWAGSAVFALLAAGSGLWQWQRPRAAPPAMV